MAQNKLETQIKEQLNAREIKPTEMAWDRLDAMLSVAEEKKSKKGFGWLSIAAVFVGLLFGGFVLFQLNSNDIQIENSVVNQESNPDKVETSTENQNEIVPSTTEISTEVAQVKSSNNKRSIINQNQNQNHHQSNQKSIQNDNPILEKQELIADNSLSNEIKIEPNIKVVPITVNPDLLLAVVESNKKEKGSKSSLKVSAKSLLAQAEGEQKQDFKETRFQKLKRNFKTVKTAVSNRNNQE
jgi:hypothetical protein